MHILIQREANKLKNGKENAKNFPYWDELLELLKDHEIMEIGKEKLTWEQMTELVNKADLCICVDSFLQHLAWYLNKKCVVIWGQSDPELFGHKENLNLLKDKSYLREHQYYYWDEVEYNSDVFLTAQEVYDAIKSNFNLV